MRMTGIVINFLANGALISCVNLWTLKSVDSAPSFLRGPKNSCLECYMVTEHWLSILTWFKYSLWKKSSVWLDYIEYWNRLNQFGMFEEQENNFVLNENSVEVKSCINRESKSDELTIYLYSFHDINMKFRVVVTPPSIYHGCSTRKTFWE